MQCNSNFTTELNVPEQRDGERLYIVDSLEAIIYSRGKAPDFAVDFEINFGGMQVYSPIDVLNHELINIELFCEGQPKLKLQGECIKKDASNNTIIKFKQMELEQRIKLTKIIQMESIKIIASTEQFRYPQISA
ncbi:hypothetical protein [Pseudoalteromonas denitrificans]|uniref:PilZ domain-containing protein n=1 Tax=Pseudoalteromonas denitrificans DSM 6059 TaxID=1123010 RepID=A0A1I1TDJ0_9GAMM|nr:hypothetical protein [Pseudoalteromonas denitrificans]SFD53550.1 hypothetical protein SAMN02745724_04783 [Pseudoalteromonas denitrificans DSM 6059]